jgi:hypothetical protein
MAVKMMTMGVVNDDSVSSDADDDWVALGEDVVTFKLRSLGRL